MHIINIFSPEKIISFFSFPDSLEGGPAELEQISNTSLFGICNSKPNKGDLQSPYGSKTSFQGRY
ncbi:hypothetical protein EL17_09420 [Anditalea andensis]|uniref:Uncharacterized protein n=1 Tax=Anditalea andensis TaxID=1048983 RepID=A0A074LJF6_9BACT|nr:hypothetical protein EL17_09420 [Anditalea andensis]